jgi:hypothetical protein
MVPSSAAELLTSLQTISANFSKVKEWKLVEESGQLQLRVDLAWGANVLGHPDFFLPLQANARVEVKRIIERLEGIFRGGGTVTFNDANELYRLVAR